MFTVIPSNERAVLHHVLLDGDALGGVRLDHATVLIPQHLHVLGHEGGLTLERQAVSLKDHLTLGRSQLERRQLKWSICGNQTVKERKRWLFLYLCPTQWPLFFEVNTVRRIPFVIPVGP